MAVCAAKFIYLHGGVTFHALEMICADDSRFVHILVVEGLCMAAVACGWLCGEWCIVMTSAAGGPFFSMEIEGQFVVSHIFCYLIDDFPVREIHGFVFSGEFSNTNFFSYFFFSIYWSFVRTGLKEYFGRFVIELNVLWQWNMADSA